MSSSRLTMRRSIAGFASVALVAGSAAVLAPSAAFAAPDGSSIVIDEVYGGGGNSGAAYTHD